MSTSGQAGYVALTLLVLLIGVGGGWMGIAGSAAKTSLVIDSLSFEDQHSLIDSRQALLSYAAVYPFLYGPAGAGPAHLPCPDTDGFTGHVQAPHVSFLHQRRDGPNPPCVESVSATGLLPRHISLPGRRYAFHSQARQRILYEVDAALVNNPLNRIVNVAVLNQSDVKPAAVISLPVADGHSQRASVVLSRSAMSEASSATVAAWIIAKSRAYRIERCGADGEDTPRTEHISASTLSCKNASVRLSDCESEHLLDMLLDVPAASGKCLISTLKHNSLEGTPASRHWFFRNAWHSSVVLTYAEECTPALPTASTCILTYPYDSRKTIAQGSMKVILHWVPQQ